MHWTDFKAWWIERGLESLQEDWRRVGAFSGGTSVPHLLDPESVIASTWTLGRLDARLFDAALQWSAEHADLLDRIRLKACLGFMSLESRAVGLAWWDCLGDGLGQPPKMNQALAQPVALFGMNDEHFPGPRSEEFRARGLERGVLSWNEGAFGAPSFESPMMGRFVLRGAFGATARTEVVALLATDGVHDTQTLADESLYGRRSVQLVVNELCRVGLASVRRGRVTATERLREVQHGFRLPSELCSGILRAKAFETLWVTSTKIERSSPSAAVRRSLLRDATERLDEALLAHHGDPFSMPHGKLTEEELLDVLHRQFESIVSTG